MRHAAAEESGPSGDASRALTEQGRRDARKAGEALKERAISQILCSPRLRARETAEIVAGVLGLKASTREGLNCGATAETYRAEFDEDVLLVGHNPEISAVAGVSFRPSTVVCIEDDKVTWVRHP